MLKPIAYHQQVKNHFKSNSKTWEYFSLSKTKEDQLVQFKSDLLKNTYKFDPQTEVELYQKVDLIKNKLDLSELKVTLYQTQYSDENNASIVYLEGEAHIIFSGTLIKILDDEELKAVLAHELSHIKLYTLENGDLEVADRIITAIGNNYGSEPVYYETARLFKLYNEIFCDRSAYAVLEKIEPIITSLVKSSTSLEKVNAESYLKQADEIFKFDKGLSTAGISHPENFIRAKAIQLWHEKKEAAEAEIVKMIEGVVELEKMDIFMQKKLADKTRLFLQIFLKPKWFRTSMVIGHAKNYFQDFFLDEEVLLKDEFITEISESHGTIKEYLSYILLDFMLIDPQLEEVPAGWAFQYAEDIGLKDVFDEIIKKEMKFSNKKLDQHKQKVLAAYYEVKENDAEQIYE